MPEAKLTERSFYPVLRDIIKSRGGSAVSEVKYNSVPDLQFELGGRVWILSVKIGEDPKTLKDAFVQYLRHKEESKITLGILLFLPEQVRKVAVSNGAVSLAINQTMVTALIDAEMVQEEFKDRPFPSLIDFISADVIPRLRKKEAAYYPLITVITFLQTHVREMMNEIALEEKTILRIITDRKLLMDLGHLEPENAEAVGRFLAAYIFLSQVLFLRLLIAAKPGFTSVKRPATHAGLRRAFRKVLEINYRPIFELDVLDSINDKYLRDTFNLIWDMRIEGLRYELPGRIFHELMPSQIRKILAAFYTRPQAADLLARLCITRSDQTIFDPACGSGTILTLAYRRKLTLHREEGKAGDPHKRYCEEEITGADIMPFAVHLTSANLAAMNPSITITKTRVIQKDSLFLRPKTYPVGVQTSLFREAVRTKTTGGEDEEIDLEPADVILMNPPFTKVERGIKRFVNMRRFKDSCGGEVGLWAHFISLADTFMHAGAIFGAVIPINVLRGRESEKIRTMLFKEWSVLYVLKPIYNYGFSEWSEYRDILFIARKGRPSPQNIVKFCLVRRNLTRLADADIEAIAETVLTDGSLRNEDLVHVYSETLGNITKRIGNLMWFLSGVDFNDRKALIAFVGKATRNLSRLTLNHFREGYRSEGGVAKILYLNKKVAAARLQEAFLTFESDADKNIVATSRLGASYDMEREAFMPSLRTGVGQVTMDVSAKCDYIAVKPYSELKRVIRASGIKIPNQERFWFKLSSEANLASHLVLTTRINPFSPDVHCIAFFASRKILPSNQLKTVKVKNISEAKSMCVLFNSIIFLSQFILTKEESTGRFIHIQSTDLQEIQLLPSSKFIHPLAKIFDRYKEVNLPALRMQLDANFDQRYKEFWEAERGGSQTRLWSVSDMTIEPSNSRIELDLSVCAALNVQISRRKLISLYEILVREMILIKGLIKD